jgi:hypothetical protein
VERGGWIFIFIFLNSLVSYKGMGEGGRGNVVFVFRISHTLCSSSFLE